MTCKCGNAARYINVRGELCCSLCPIKEGVDSIQIAKVPDLMKWLRAFLSRNRGDELIDQRGNVYALDRLREIVGKDSST